jgi:serine/threonine protein phosphatase PrpC
VTNDHPDTSSRRTPGSPNPTPAPAPSLDPSSRRTPGSPDPNPAWPLWATDQRAGELAQQQPQPDAQEFSTLALAAPCPRCLKPVRPDERYCENCGWDVHPEVGALPGPSDSSEATVKLNRPQQSRPACVECGGQVDSDGYCQTCGTKAPSPRDRFEASPADWVGGVCDRGVVHARNEDAMALWAAPGDERNAVLVVCDGVTSSQDSDVASLAAAERARDVLAASQPAGLAVTASHDAALDAALVDAAAQANAAVLATTAADSVNAASCTFAAAVVHGDRVHWASLGDSRIYVLGAESVQLSTDDSVAEELIRAGSSRHDAETGPQAHAITRWLGRDADDIVPRTGTHQVTGDSWLVVCSDGLWNYASEPSALAAQVATAAEPGGSPTQIAARLVKWANAQGGKDNVTVALARLTATLNEAAGADEAPATAVQPAPPIVEEKI